MKPLHYLFILLAALVLAACSTPAKKSSTPSRYQHKQDFTPSKNVDVHKLKEPIPQYEPLSRRGNPQSYEVWGKRYSVMKSAEGYREVGEASWYGMKFHGHETSNGEIYDVYQFTAAHKSLPLPTYVRVTRVDTGKSVVVRVNDRGPFHGKRIIDLSYAAAIKLGIDKAGVAKVKVEALTFPKPAPEAETIKPKVEPAKPQLGAVPAPVTAAPAQRWVQVGAFAELASAMNLQAQLDQHLAGSTWPIVVSRNEHIHRVRIGPVPLGEDLEQVLMKLEAMNIHNYQILTRN